MRLELYARGYLPDERGEDVERSSGKDNDDVIDEEFEGLSAEERLELAARRAHERSSKLLTDEEVRALEMTGAEAPEFGAPAQQTLIPGLRNSLMQRTASFTLSMLRYRSFFSSFARANRAIWSGRECVRSAAIAQKLGGRSDVTCSS